MFHKLPTETVNKILAYLSTQPYSQVTALIREIQTNAEHIVPEIPTEENQEETAEL